LLNTFYDLDHAPKPSTLEEGERGGGKRIIGLTPGNKAEDSLMDRHHPGSWVYTSLVIALSCGRAYGAVPRDLEERSRSAAPPPQLTAILKHLGETSFSVEGDRAEAWRPRAPCDPRACQSMGACFGLRRSYLSELIFKKKSWMKIRVWAWEYETDHQADLVQSDIEAYDCLTGAQKSVLLRQGRLLIVGVATCRCSRGSLFQMSDPFLKKMREILGPTPASALRRDARTRSLVDRTLTGNAAPRRPVPDCERLKKQILDPLTPDKDLAGLYNPARCPDHEGVLNRRGMSFYAKKDYVRAALSFESDVGHPLAVYNRACVAGIQGRPEEAVSWLSKLLELGPPDTVDYCTSSPSEKSLKLLRRSLTDQDFSAIRGSAVFKAFRKCIVR
jgi:hypothetical protein